MTNLNNFPLSKHLKHPYNALDTHWYTLIHPCNTLNTPLKHPGQILGTLFIPLNTFLKHPWNYFSTLGNTQETPMKHPWHTFWNTLHPLITNDISRNTLETPLKHSWNNSNTRQFKTFCVTYIDRQTDVSHKKSQSLS